MCESGRRNRESRCFVWRSGGGCKRREGGVYIGSVELWAVTGGHLRDEVGRTSRLSSRGM